MTATMILIVALAVLAVGAAGVLALRSTPAAGSAPVVERARASRGLRQTASVLLRGRKVSVPPTTSTGPCPAVREPVSTDVDINITQATSSHCRASGPYGQDVLTPSGRIRIPGLAAQDHTPIAWRDVSSPVAQPIAEAGAVHIGEVTVRHTAEGRITLPSAAPEITWSAAQD